MKKRLFLPFLIGVGLLAAGTPVSGESPYTTGTLGPGGFFVQTQDAYTPLDQIDLPVSAPEDMFVAPDGTLYIADTANGRVLRLDEHFEIAAELGADILQSPTGVFVDEDGTLYIADGGRNEIVILDAEGNLINQFGRPDEPLFGANRQFLPRKIAVDRRKNLYIVSEGSVNGLVMMNTNGDFIGYFGANQAEMSLKMILQRLFLNEEQLEQFIRNEAASPYNLTIDHESLVYTVTAGADSSQSIRKFNVSGGNLLRGVWGSSSFRAIHVSENGLIAAVNANGSIYEYDLNGTLLFTFGTQDTVDQRLGLLSNPTDIERIGEDLVVLDADKNALVTYRVTDFARRIHDGVRLYTEGFYNEARPYFEDVLTDNGLVIMAYEAIANADYMEGDYSGALAFFRYAENRSGYSETFWELRNAVLQRSLGTALGVVAGGWLTLSIFNRVERRRRWLDPLRRALRGARRIHLIDDFAFLFRFIKQPVDSFYYIKTNERGRLLFALLLYAWILISRILSIYLTHFVFSPYAAAWQIPVETEITYTIVLIVLWNVANYLVSTVTDGEGSLRHSIIGTAYSLFPSALFTLPIALLSNLLTLNEIFLYNFSSQLVLFWSAIMLFIMVKEIHNYSISETIRNILTTLFTMAIFLLAGYILYVLFNQLYEFILALTQEVGLRG